MPPRQGGLPYRVSSNEALLKFEWVDFARSWSDQNRSLPGNGRRCTALIAQVWSIRKVGNPEFMRVAAARRGFDGRVPGRTPSHDDCSQSRATVGFSRSSPCPATHSKFKRGSNEGCAPSMCANLWGASPLWEYRLGLIVSKDNHEPKARAKPRGIVWRKPECKRCEATDRNRIQGRGTRWPSWHMTAKPTGTQPTVNAALVHRQFAVLPGEICAPWRRGTDGRDGRVVPYPKRTRREVGVSDLKASEPTQPHQATQRALQ